MERSTRIGTIPTSSLILSIIVVLVLSITGGDQGEAQA